jgi:hypothetical protein
MQKLAESFGPALTVGAAGGRPVSLLASAGLPSIAFGLITLGA